jgi:CubicO group peptidase (beta-lactamase class C family)
MVLRALALVGLVACAGPMPSGSTPDAGAPSVDAPDLGAELDEFVASRMTASGIPGLAAAIVKDGDVAWSKGYGLADVAAEKPVTSDTLFMLASVSKTFVAVQAMHLVEAGLVDLDADVNTYLAFSVRNPSFPSRAITLRHLLAHVSGIEDTDASFETYTDGDCPITLDDWLPSYLVPGGAQYSADVWSGQMPGARYSYSNQGIALAAHVLERAAGVPFDAYSEANVFPPLGMTETSWRLSELDAEDIAIPYEGGSPVEHYGYPDYPAGALRTSVNQLGHFLAMMAGEGTYHGTRVVSGGSVTEMLRIQYPPADSTQGLVFYHSTVGAGAVVGHDGLDIGVLTLMAYRPSDGVGAIVLTNGFSTENGASAVFNRLFVEADAL